VEKNPPPHLPPTSKGDKGVGEGAGERRVHPGSRIHCWPGIGGKEVLGEGGGGGGLS